MQKNWDDRLKDFGLSRMALIITLFNILIFSLALILFKKANLYMLLPVLVCVIFYSLRNYIVKKGHLFLLIMNAMLINMAISYNYYMVGAFDRMAGKLDRLDGFALKFDLLLFGTPPALLIEKVMISTQIFATLFYDSIMVAYLLYYALPYVGGIFYYLHLPTHLKYRVGRFAVSIVIYYCLNYILYFTIPITGPQHYITEAFSTQLPFSAFGLWLFNIVKGGQLNFVDCFPSGHVGATFLVTFWLYKINHKSRFIITAIFIGVFLATIALRYHYLIDAIVAIPFAIGCYYLSALIYPAPVEAVLLRRENGR